MDQLNRTIEDLEARIQGLMTGKRRGGMSSNPVDEIRERQRMLGTRDRSVPAYERTARAEMDSRRAEVEPRYEPRYEARYSQDPRPAYASRPQPSYNQPAYNQPQPTYNQQQQAYPPQPAYAPPQQAASTAAIDEIASMLAELRNEIRQFNPGDLNSGLSEIRDHVRSLKGSTANLDGSAYQIRDELARLGERIEHMASQPHDFGGIDDLRAELDELKRLAGGLAREDSVRKLASGLEQTDARIAELDTHALREELVQLAWRLDWLKDELGTLSTAPAVRALEDKLIALANSVEQLGRNVNARGDFTDQFASLDQRLDEISRAIAASAAQGAASTDSLAFKRLEDRVAELTAHIDLLQGRDRASEVAERIDTLAQRLDELASDEAAQKIEQRIAQLSSLIERNFRDGSSPALAHHLDDISRKLDGINPSTDALAERLDMLARRLDEFEVRDEPHPLPVVDLSFVPRLESQLADIAARLDETTAAPATDPHALENLERQIANLSELLMHSPAAGVAAPQVSNDGFSERMAAIEDYLASSDQFIVEAARQAAEAVVEAYSRQGVNPGSGAPAPDLSALAGLADDLRALEAHARSSEERTAETFAALHQTLVQIASKLDDLSVRPVERVEVPTPPREREPEQAQVRADVRMPRASQPEFASAETMMAEEKPRAHPTNARVDILQDEDFFPEAVAPELPEQTAAAVEPPAEKKEKPAQKSLIAGLAAKLKPGKKEKAASERVAVEPAPALDAGDMMVTEESSLIMEPGAGVPDVKKIMEKVRAGQRSGSASSRASAGAADVIAAARRAAQAAAEEAGSQKFTQKAPAKGKSDKAAKGSKAAKPVKDGKGETRRPILLAAAAVLLVVMSYPLVSNLIGGGASEDVPPAELSVTSTEGEEAMSSVQSAAEEADAEEARAMEAETTGQAPAADSQQDTATAANELMTPAADIEQTSRLHAPVSEPAVEEEPAAALDAASAEMREAVPADSQATALGATSDAITAAAEAPVAVEIPNGLQPASLVEAVKNADPVAYFEVGSRYTDGRDVEVDLAAAAKWYQLAADKGFAPAEYRLASFYEKGTGVARDLEKARTLYLSAAEKGNASAMHNLAVLYATGATGTPDFKEAARWFTAAADLNVRDSQFNLAILYARGSGVEQDLTESYKWFAVAARQGDQDAAQKRDEVANAMSAEQLKSAKAKVDLWKPKEMDETANTAIVPDEWLAKSNTTASVDMKRAVRNIQAILNNNGFDAGTPDGEIGKKTITAIKAFQKSVGLEPTGKIDDKLVRELLKRNKKA